MLFPITRKNDLNTRPALVLPPSLPAAPCFPCIPCVQVSELGSLEQIRSCHTEDHTLTFGTDVINRKTLIGQVNNKTRNRPYSLLFNTSPRTSSHNDGIKGPQTNYCFYLIWYVLLTITLEPSWVLWPQWSFVHVPCFHIIVYCMCKHSTYLSVHKPGGGDTTKPSHIAR